MFISEPLSQNPDATLQRVPYTLQLTCGAARPEVVLAVPLLVEVVGAGFTKAKQAQASRVFNIWHSLLNFTLAL